MLLLNKHNLAVSEFASTEEDRFTMRAVLVTEKETVATNGHYLVRVSTPTENPEQFPVVSGFRNGAAFKNFLLPVDTAKEILKSLPRKTTVPVLNNALVGHFEEEGGEVKPNLAVTDLDSPKVYTPRLVTGQFPNWEAVVPTKIPTWEIYLDASYLTKLASAAAKFTDTTPPVIRLQLNGPNNSLRLDAKNENTQQGWTAVLMPLRGAATMVTTPSSVPSSVPEPVSDPFVDVPEHSEKVPYPDAATDTPDAWRNCSTCAE